LTICENPQEVLSYNLRVIRFDEFHKSVWWVQNNLMGRCSCTSDFGRAPSLRNSIAVMRENEEEEAERTVFDNVQVREAMDVDDLEGIEQSI